MTATLRIDGAVARPGTLTADDLHALTAVHQIADVRELGAKRPGRGVRLLALLELVGVQPSATHVGLHAECDDFHASIPLEPIVDRAIVIFAPLDGEANELPRSAGGPFRFFIPEHAACRADEIDECANVKFLDRIELTVGKGFDNRPHDEDEHAKLHQRENTGDH
ncbi:MAG: molybdopterin-dependent oxidoreductase [Planctomycetales bacterium]|nr:molybdopterin-dependent oxidoreductase [Planctomycetales bacterium]